MYRAGVQFYIKKPYLPEVTISEPLGVLFHALRGKFLSVNTKKNYIQPKVNYD
jgi:hypothetical protein